MKRLNPGWHIFGNLIDVYFVAQVFEDTRPWYLKWVKKLEQSVKDGCRRDYRWDGENLNDLSGNLVPCWPVYPYAFPKRFQARNRMYVLKGEVDVPGM